MTGNWEPDAMADRADRDSNDPVMSRRKLMQGAGLGVLGLAGGSLLAACGGGGGTTAGSPAARAVAGGEARVGLLGFPIEWDSAHAARQAIYLARNVLDRLVEITPDLKPAPGLARSWRTPDGARTWDFELVDTTWHDGKPFTSKDVVAHFTRILDPDTKSAGQSIFALIDDIVPRGPHGVRFKLSEPDAEFPANTGALQGAIQAAHIDPAEYGSVPMVGTGPFKWDKLVPGRSLRLVKNDRYFVKGRPLLDSITLLAFSDDQTRLNAITSGQVDWASDVTKDLIALAQGNQNARVVESKPGVNHTVYLRADEAPGDDPRIMQAIKLAVDRKALIESVLRGYGTPTADNPVPKGLPGYAELSVPTRDVEAARRLLAEAGHASGLDLTMVVPQDIASLPSLGLALQSALGDIGVKVKLRFVPADDFYAKYWTKQQFSVTNWGPRPSVDAQIQTTYSCDSPWNESHWCDKRFLDMATDARREPDESRRAELYREVQTYFSERGPALIPYQLPIVSVVGAKIGSFVEHPFVQWTDWSRVGMRAA